MRLNKEAIPSAWVRAYIAIKLFHYYPGPGPAKPQEYSAKEIAWFAQVSVSLVGKIHRERLLGDLNKKATDAGDEVVADLRKILSLVTLDE